MATQALLRSLGQLELAILSARITPRQLQLGLELGWVGHRVRTGRGIWRVWD